MLLGDRVYPTLPPCYKLHTIDAISGNDLARYRLHPGGFRGSFCGPERAVRLGLALEDPLENDPIAGTKARIERRVDHADLLELRVARVLGERHRLVTSVDLRDAAQDDR